MLDGSEQQSWQVNKQRTEEPGDCAKLELRPRACDVGVGIHGRTTTSEYHLRQESNHAVRSISTLLDPGSRLITGCLFFFPDPTQP